MCRGSEFISLCRAAEAGLQRKTGGISVNILIFGGTTEGRELAERLAAEIPERGWPKSQRAQNDAERKRDFLTVSVATELGAEELQKIEGIGILVGRMDIPAMKKTLCGYDLCIDATHPYAVEATKNIRTACEETGVQYRRLLREPGEETNGPEVVYVSSAEDAAAFLVSREGRILLTTGAKEVGAFSEIARERLYVRILPMKESLLACERAGVPHRNVVAMYGPFSQEMNEAILRQFRIDWLVTKEAGEAGGFPEKIAAARAAGVRTVVIRRPVEHGVSLEEILQEVRKLSSRE